MSRFQITATPVRCPVNAHAGNPIWPPGMAQARPRWGEISSPTLLCTKYSTKYCSDHKERRGGEKHKMTREDAAFIATIAGAVLTGIGAIGSLIGAWFAREATKRRGRHRR